MANTKTRVKRGHFVPNITARPRNYSLAEEQQDAADLNRFCGVEEDVFDKAARGALDDDRIRDMIRFAA